MKYFKVWVGYDKVIKIDENELPKALAAHITGGIAVLDNASVSGKNITLIEPDYHKAMGWNEGYKFLPEDWEQINRELPEYKGYIAGVKNEVNQLFLRGKEQELLS